MTLATERAKSVHVPTCNVYLDGFLLSTPVLSCTVDLGYDSVASAAEVVFAANIATQAFSWRRQQLAIDLGWGGYVARVFTGVVDTRERSAGPLTNHLRATGRMALAMLNYQNDVSYSSTTGKAIISDLLERAGILATNVNIDDEPGGAITFGTVVPVVHKTGSAPVQTIDRIDNCFGMRTYDTRPGIVVRRRSTGQPSLNARVTRSKSNPDFFSLKRHETISDIRNKVVVIGMPQTDGSTLAEGAIADNPLVPNPPGYLPLIVTEDLLQTSAQCQTSANILIADVNPLRETVEYEIVGDPLVQPGDTEGLTWDDLGWAIQTNYRVKHVRHSVSASGFFTTIQGDGFTSAPGSTPGETDVTPNAAFTMVVIKRSDHWEIDCTDQSTDPDGTIASRAWSNDQTGDTGTGLTYNLDFSLSRTTCTITLVVTDNDGLTDTATQTTDLSAIGGSGDGTPPIQDGTGGSGTPTSPLPTATPQSLFTGAFLGGKALYTALDPFTYPAYASFWQAGYDDSSWAAPVLACPTIGRTYPPGTLPISWDVSCSLPNGFMIYRYEFTMDGGQCTLTDVVAAGDDRYNILLNGVNLVFDPSGAGASNPAFANILKLGVNVLAIIVENTGGGGHNVAFAFRVGTQ